MSTKLIVMICQGVIKEKTDLPSMNKLPFHNTSNTTLTVRKYLESRKLEKKKRSDFVKISYIVFWRSQKYTL